MWQEIKKLHRETTLGAKEGIAFRYFSRPLASFILYFIRSSRITPNQVTIASLLVAVLGAVAFLAVISYAGLIIGGALFMLAHVLDALDGQLARHRKAGSEVGMHFDFFIDEIKAYMVFVAIGLRLFFQHQRGLEGFNLLSPFVDGFGTESVLLLTILGLAGLSIGISCTQFLKLDSWKATFPPKGPSSEGGSSSTSALAGVIALVEKAGKLVIDYPSYIILLCILDRVDLYFLLYTAAVCLYSLRALTSIAIKLWRIDPYRREAESSASVTPANRP